MMGTAVASLLFKQLHVAVQQIDRAADSTGNV